MTIPTTDRSWESDPLPAVMVDFAFSRWSPIRAPPEPASEWAT